MLQTLSIRDFVIVDRLDLEFNTGFTVLTGETGAGKSILIDALSLALGARGEGGITRAGCEKAEITAQFDIASEQALQQWMAENEIPDDDHQLLLRRVIYADGRSRAFINGMSSTVQQLRDVGEFLVDIYSQHAHHSLLKPAYQRETLDQFAGLTELSRQVASAFKAWHALYQQRTEMEQNAAAYADELASLRDEVRELKQLAPVEAEWEPLQQEHARLSNGASLLAGGEQCRELLSEGELAAVHQLNAVQHKLQSLAAYDTALNEIVALVDSALIQIDEADRSLNRYLQRTELDPERLVEVESRMQALHAAARKYRVRPEELESVLVSKTARIEILEGLGEDGALARQEQEAKEAYLRDAGALSAKRTQAAERLGQEITLEMQRLALAGGIFSVSLTPQEFASTGLEQVEFLVAGHAGVAPRPLSKVASGGELSRISLAIRVVTAQQGDIATMIFDEVDVGIGGGVAEIVGQLLARLGKRRQILVITHLPQVAAQGKSHWKVSKSQMHGHTLSTIHVLEQADRIEEIARMLGGVEITETTRQHASEMLAVAGD
jgi:DNA repair protein RecN (Recombination protein N)